LTPSLEARGGVRGSGLDLHDSNIEGIWSTIKRGIVGSFPKIGRKYMPLYIPEFQFRYNDYTITPDVIVTRGSRRHVGCLSSSNNRGDLPLKSILFGLARGQGGNRFSPG
jgi:hypothetical protein